MKYYKFQDEETPIGDAITYIETEDGYAIRQISFNGTAYVASNVFYPPWGLLLAEKQIDYDSFDEVTPISEQEFDEIWRAHLATRQQEWIKVKQTYPLGMAVQGAIHQFLPQGVTVVLGGEAIGLADYAACKASTNAKFIMSTRDKITAIVEGYDEEYQWITLASPQVYEERVA
jgi:hypothetical protein